MLGTLRANQGDLPAARNAYRAAIDSGHVNYAPQAAWLLGRTYTEQPDVFKAAAAFKQAIGFGHPVHSPMAALDLGTLHREQGRRAAAEAAFRQVLSFDNPDCTPLAQAALADLGSGRMLPASAVRSPRGPGQSGYAAEPSQTQTGPHGTPPPNHLTFAIIAAVFGFWPLGIPAVLHAARVDSRWAYGDAAGANAESAKANSYATGSLIVTFAVITAFALLAAWAAGQGTRPGL